MDIGRRIRGWGRIEFGGFRKVPWRVRKRVVLWTSESLDGNISWLGLGGPVAGLAVATWLQVKSLRALQFELLTLCG
jgi:hypothetical protein